MRATPSPHLAIWCSHPRQAHGSLMRARHANAGSIQGAVTTSDEVQGFRYFDDRDLLGFVDGTENPTGSAARTPSSWRRRSDFRRRKLRHPPKVSSQPRCLEQALHRNSGKNHRPQKSCDIELDDSVKPTSAHSALTTIEENGREIKILRDNMPFGRPGYGEFGTISSATAARPAPSSKC